MKILKSLSILCLLFMVACNTKKPQPVMCTEEARAGLNIKVVDAITLKPLGDSVNVVAKDGAYSESLQLFTGNDPYFVGAWERPGTYEITVSKNHYKTLVSSPIIVGKDACHVIAQTLTLALQPN